MPIHLTNKFTSVLGNVIKYCAIIICALYLVMMPFVFLVADKDDAPGLIIFGMIPKFVSAVVAVFTSVSKITYKDSLASLVSPHLPGRNCIPGFRQ